MLAGLRLNVKLTGKMFFFTWEQFLDLAWCLLCETDKFYSEIVFSLSILGNQDHCIKRSALQQQLLV